MYKNGGFWLKLFSSDRGGGEGSSWLANTSSQSSRDGRRIEVSLFPFVVDGFSVEEELRGL